MIRKPGVDTMADNTETAHESAEKHKVEATSHEETTRKLEAKLKKLEVISVVFAILALIFATVALYPHAVAPTKASLSVSTTSVPPTAGSVGRTLAGIDAPLSSSELAVINNAPNSDFETAGEMMLNLTLPGETINQSMGAYVGIAYLMKLPTVQPLIVNGKPSVIYLGAISCIYCAENRWAMALALSRFGSFNALYNGYSSLNDGDVPTLYWGNENITGTGSVSFKNYYASNYINFFSAEYDSNITSGFQLPSSGISYFIQGAPDQYNRSAMAYINNVIQFRGTPTTLFGTTVNGGVDAVVFGIPNSTTESSNLPPLTYMTHAGILEQFKDFDTAFSAQEYAGADVYVAQICRAINNTAPVCSLKSIASMEGILNNGII
jgi:hypothetical protein